MPQLSSESARASPASFDIINGTCSSTPPVDDNGASSRWGPIMNSLRDNKWLVLGGLGIAAVGYYLYNQGSQVNNQGSAKTELKKSLDDFRAKTELAQNNNIHVDPKEKTFK